MNNTWKSNSQSSPGFIPFNSSPQKANTSDFIAFGNPHPSPGNRNFSPSNCSSPQQQQQQWNSPRNYNNHRGRNKYNRFSGHNNSFSPNKSYNSSYNRSNSFNKFNRSKDEKSFNKQSYFHPSFLEDPWAELEANLYGKNEAKHTITNNDDSEEEAAECIN